jgi:hypothetical protein
MDYDGLWESRVHFTGANSDQHLRAQSSGTPASRAHHSQSAPLWKGWTQDWSPTYWHPVVPAAGTTYSVKTFPKPKIESTTIFFGFCFGMLIVNHRS